MSGDGFQPTYEVLCNLIDLSPDVICATDKTGRFVYVSKSSVHIWGYLPEEIIGKTDHDFVLLVDVGKLTEAIARLIRGEEHALFENHYYHQNGSIIPLLWTGKWDHKKEVAYWIARHVTGNKEAEIKVIAQSEKRFRALVQHSYEMISIIDLEGNYQYNSDSVYRILGYNNDDLIGSNALRLVHPDDLPRVSAALQRLYTESFVNDVDPFRFKNKRGEWIWVEVTGTNLVNDESVKGVVLNAREVTDKIRLQKKLAKELATRQRQVTAAAISAQERERAILGIELHDNVNQVLSTIKLYIEMFLSGSVDGNGILQKATAYTQDCINEIRSISRRLSAPSLGDLTLKESVRELVRTVNVEEKIKFHIDIAEMAISEEVHLALYRIIQEQLSNIKNHSYAKNASVKISITQKMIRLLVKDDGRGFNTEAQKNGIGLMSIASRVESLNGQLAIRSGKDKGCELSVVLPHPDKRSAKP